MANFKVKKVEKKVFTMQLPLPLWKFINKAAKKNETSMNKICIELITNSVEDSLKKDK